MGEGLTQDSFSREDRMRYRQKVRRCLDVFALMLDDAGFSPERPMTGLEIELNLVDESDHPAMRNAEVLANLSNPAFQSELGQFNLEVNVDPRLIAGEGLVEYERDILASLNQADERAAKCHAALVLIGILPTLTRDHTVPDSISANPRYQLLNEQILAARGADFELDIRGPEWLRATVDSIAAEAACTSTQLHLQVEPESFANYWNASQALAGVQVAIGANSPFLFGRRLWAETRIALFEQATDPRPDQLKAQGAAPRVWFGERWITSIFDLFEENIRYFPPLLPICDAEDPDAVLRAGGVPKLAELRLHNGTIYRWNRPVYDIRGGCPHLRVENRVLPSGPTVVDLLANAALYFGLVRTLAEADRPVWTRMGFSAAERNFSTAARDGIDARLWWPGRGEVPVTELVLDDLLPMAATGLDQFGVDARVRDRLLGIIEARCALRRNGARWQTEVVGMFEREHNMTRPQALQAMVQRYRQELYRNEPVHLWPVR